MRVLLTGPGSIGRYLLKRCEITKEFENVTIVGRNQPPFIGKKFKFVKADLLDCSTLSALRGMKFDVVFHLAGKATNTDSTLLNNVEITKNLIETIPPPDIFINASSATVYGNQSGVWPKEFTEGDNCEPSSLYSLSKLTCEHLINITLGGKSNIIHARLCGAAGYNFRHGLVSDIARKLRSDNEFLELFGNYPGTIKPMLWAAEAAKLLVELAFQKPEIGYTTDCVNIAAPNVLSVAEVADIGMEVLGIKKPIKWLGEKSLWHGDNKFLYVSTFKSYKMGLTKARHSIYGVKKAFIDILAEVYSIDD